MTGVFAAIRLLGCPRPSTRSDAKKGYEWGRFAARRSSFWRRGGPVLQTYSESSRLKVHVVLDRWDLNVWLPPLCNVPPPELVKLSGAIPRKNHSVRVKSG